MSNQAQRSFGSGEVAPGWYARTDTVRYQTGLRTCRNFIVQKEGGLVNRPGTDFVQQTWLGNTAARLMKFVFNEGTAFALEVGEQYARFYQNGAPVMAVSGGNWTLAHEYLAGDVVANGGALYYCITDHTSAGSDEPGVGVSWPTLWYQQIGGIFSIPMPYAVGDLEDLQYIQSGNVVTMVHGLYPPHELVRDGTRWITRKIDFGPTLDGPINIVAVGTGSAGNSFYAVTAIMEGTLEESLPTPKTYAKLGSETNPNTLTWDPISGAISYNVYRSIDGVTYGLLGAAGGLPSEHIDDTSWGTPTNTASAAGTAFVAGTGIINALAAISVTNRAYDGVYKVVFVATLDPGPTNPVAIFTNNRSKGRVKIYFSRDSEPYQLTAGSGGMAQASGTHTNGPFSWEESIFVPDNGYTTLSIKVVPEAAAPGGGLGASADFIITGTSVSWRKQVPGYIDTGLKPDFATAPPNDPGLFKAGDDYPTSAAYFQQRLFLGASVAEPIKVWGSQIGNFHNYSHSTPLIDTDSVAFSLVGPQENEVRHLMDVGKLLVMTAGGEMKIDGDDAGIIRPDAINPSSVSDNGSKASLRPLKVADSMIYVQARGTSVRGLRPVEAGGQLSGYNGTDLTVFASHLFKGKTLVDWDYAKNPDSVVWAVRSDGILLGMTYLPEFGLWGWHRHDTDGVVESVVCLPEGDEDRVYLIVRRTIDGTEVRYVERMAQRYFDDIEDAQFADAATRYDGNNTTATTATITSAGAWTYESLLTITFSGATITAAIVGQGIFFVDDAGETLRIRVSQYISGTVAKGFAERTVPVELRNVATVDWALAINTLAGLEHLEGEAVSILGDGFVVASPNNTEVERIVVTDGEVSWADPFVRVVVGLPFISDMQTLDLDTPSGPSAKERKTKINKVGLTVRDTRGIFAGKPNTTTADDPLAGLLEYKAREEEDWNDPNALITDSIEVDIESSWDNNGRVFIRQVDPLPVSILSITPIGYM